MGEKRKSEWVEDLDSELKPKLMYDSTRKGLGASAGSPDASFSDSELSEASSIELPTNKGGIGGEKQAQKNKSIFKQWAEDDKKKRQDEAYKKFDTRSAHLDTEEFSLQDYLELVAGEKNLDTQPKKGLKAKNGKQLWSFGKKIMIYWQENVIFYTTDREEYRPCHIDTLLKVAYRAG